MSLARFAGFVIAGVVVPSALSAQEPAGGWPQHSRERPPPTVQAPPVQSLPAPRPTGALSLFDGTTLAGWQVVSQTPERKPARWKLVDGAAMEVAKGTGDIQTTAAFGDVELHVEWASPNPAEGKDQDRGNSGVFLMGTYEVQVLDSYGHATYADGSAASIFGQFPPRVNVSRPPGEWQSFDIRFTRPRFDAAGMLLSPARLTVRHNGILVHDDVALLGPTSHARRDPYVAHADRLPIKLQDHSHPVRFRNIWVRDLEKKP